MRKFLEKHLFQVFRSPIASTKMTVTASTSSPEPTCKHLVLDAGPLLSFSPLRNLSQTYYVVSQVISELKDSRAKAHFESLALNAGVRIQVRNPSPASLSHGASTIILNCI